MNLRQKLFQSTAFISYWLRAVNEHSLHPPFIYNVYTRAIKPVHSQAEFKEIERTREKLLSNESIIEITDLGAGSSLTTNRQRKVCDLARHSLTSARFSQVLFRLIQHMGARHILELGTSLGINTLYLSAASPEGRVFTLEGCPQTAGVARKTIASYPEASNISLIEGNIDHSLPEVLKKEFTQVDAAYIDANHTYPATLRYFNTLLPFLHDSSFVVIDDIYWSDQMKKAWLEIRQHEKVSMSLDLFDAGILFFQPGLQKAHYILQL